MKLLIFLVLVLIALTLKVHANNFETFIVNGDESPHVRFYAYLEIFRESDLSGSIFYFGGGCLITSRKILTVAQNVVGYRGWRIGLGANRISNMNWFISTEAYAHPAYNSVRLSHNIAVILVSGVLTGSNSLTIVRMPINDFPKGGETMHVVGFGFVSINHQPDVLQQSQLTVLSEEDCAAAYPHLKETKQLDMHFCALNQTAQSNICAGDQGGPIYSNILNMLIGLQSFNRVRNCSLAEALPPAFIKVAPYSDWINGIQ